MLKALVDALFPPKCPFCGKIPGGKLPLCSDCFEKLPLTDKVRTCRRCSAPLPGKYAYDLCSRCQMKKRICYEHVFAPLIYTGKAKQAVISLKYYTHPSYADAFAFLITEKILNYSGYFHFDFVTFVPQNSNTFFMRGYNQSELIARKVARYLHLPCKKTLIRTNEGQRQATLPGKKRHENVRKSYFSGNKKLEGNVLLVDDVFTTGETMSYCSYLLKTMGCDKVYGAAALIKSGDIFYEYEREDN